MFDVLFYEKNIPISKSIFQIVRGASCFPLRKVRRKCWSTDPLSTQGGFSLCQVSNTAEAKLYVSSKSSGFFLIHHTPMPINRHDLTNFISGGRFVSGFHCIDEWMNPVLSAIKGQTKSEWFFQADISSKKQTKEFYITTMKPQVNLFSFIFWRKLKTPEIHFEIFT